MTSEQEPRQEISKKQFDEERALYALQNADVKDCIFAGPEDGESALKEARNIAVEGCHFSLRYPLWHTHSFLLSDSTMDSRTRAALWYDQNGTINQCHLEGIKALRECSHIALLNCTIESPEFGWKCNDISLSDSTVDSEYIFLDSRNVRLKNVRVNGKYSFQYMKNLTIENSILDTKDAFWHSRNVVIRNCTVSGEYLGWFSEKLTLDCCHISGTQPFCYCKGLKLIDCTMDRCDLSFEYSEVEADVRGHIDSVKNPKKGTITADSVGDIIWGNEVMDCCGKVVIRKKRN